MGLYGTSVSARNVDQFSRLADWCHFAPMIPRIELIPMGAMPLCWFFAVDLKRTESKSIDSCRF